MFTIIKHKTLEHIVLRWIFTYKHVNNYHLAQDIKHYHYFRRFLLVPSKSLTPPTWRQPMSWLLLPHISFSCFKTSYQCNHIVKIILCLSTFAKQGISDIHSRCYKHPCTWFLCFGFWGLVFGFFFYLY